jgi:NAD(P)H-hydrate epimerase
MRTEIIEETSVEIWDDIDVKKYFPKRKRDTNKGDYGVANIVSGAKNYLGASVLATQSALKSGCGYVKLTCDDYLKNLMLVRYPQVIYLKKIDKGASALAIGMGGGVNKALYNKICALLKGYDGVLLIDADGLNCLAKYGLSPLKNTKARVVLTPHLKEFSRLLGKSVQEIKDEPIKLAVQFAREFNVTLVLKSSTTIIADGRRVAQNLRGTTALAKAGSGDMLSGFIAGTCARGVDPFDACVCSTFLMGLSAEISSGQKTDYCATANDIIKNLPSAIKMLGGI